MPTNTEHYNLIKQLGSEHPSISSIDSNFDVIDTELYKNRLITGTTAPTTATVGAVGQFYLNTTTGALYRCTAIIGSVYSWRPATFSDWSLIQTYASAGTFLWVAPDTYGDGLPYEIGVFIMGGGGSGTWDSANDRYGGGGGGGHVTNIVLKVTPGVSYSVVVGAKGTGAANDGNSGGTSTFNGINASGGNGGTLTKGGNGGSGGGAPGDNGRGVGGDGGCNGKDGTITRGSDSQSVMLNLGGIGDGSRCINIFDLSMKVSGGGGGHGYGGFGVGGVGYGGSGGSGEYNYGNATGNGNGGGYHGSESSGDGTPGLVLIYRRAAL